MIGLLRDARGVSKQNFVSRRIETGDSKSLHLEITEFASSRDRCQRRALSIPFDLWHYYRPPFDVDGRFSVPGMRCLLNVNLVTSREVETFAWHDRIFQASLFCGAICQLDSVVSFCMWHMICFVVWRTPSLPCCRHPQSSPDSFPICHFSSLRISSWSPSALSASWLCAMSPVISVHSHRCRRFHYGQGVAALL
jgi:hypothetical protein